MTPPATVDLLVVGAGPAGCAAAIWARRLGLDVLVIDRASFPRDKICGDGLTTNALRLLDQLDVATADLPSAVPGGTCTIRSPSGREVTIPLAEPADRYSVVVPRRELDARLVQRARDAGAQIIENASLSALNNSTGELDVRFKLGSSPEAGDAAGSRRITDLAVNEESAESPEWAIAAKWVVAADGMWSPTRRLLGDHVPGYRGDWHGFRQYFSSVSPRAGNELFVSFEADILPGYFWSFPLAGGRANVGFGVQRPGTGLPTKVERIQDMASIWRDLLLRPHIAEFLGPHATPEETHRAWPIPARISSVDLHRGRVLFAGDAAAACDPMTGEGIGQALQTGIYAASAIGQSLRDGGAAGVRYERMIRRSLVPDHRIAHLLASALGHRKGARSAIAAVDINDWTRRNFGRWLFEDYPRAALASPRRWSSLGRKSSGATGRAPWEERLLRR